MATKLILNVLFLLFFAVIEASSPGKYARVVRSSIVSNTTYDFVIIGGGIGGLTVADRLTEDPNVTVLVIEYGPFDKGEDSVLIPGAYNPFPYLKQDLFSVPQPGLTNEPEFIPVGSVVGGGSTVNAMFFIRCTSEDYDSVASFGNPGWGSSDLLPYFKKSENFTAPDPTFAKERNITFEPSFHGTLGPVHASYSPFDYPGGQNFWDASLSLGIPELEDPDSGESNGLFWLLRALNPDTETRSYARIAHYDRVIATRPNYHLMPETAAGKLLFEGKKAVGVQYINRTSGVVTNVTATKEVILAAGAVHSPQILILSGVGPKKTLDQFNISLVHDLPGVGTNFQDHLDYAITYNFSANLFPNADDMVDNATYIAEQRVVYDTTRRGPFTLILTTGNDFVTLPLRNATSDWESVLASAQSINPASILPNGTDPTVLAGYIVQRENLLARFAGYKTPIGSISWNTGSTTTLYMIKPLSRGSVTIGSTDPLTNPVVDFGAVKDPTDLDLMLALFLKNREIMQQPSMQVLGPTEVVPGANVTSDEALKAAFRATIVPTNGHACCTLPMVPLALGGVVNDVLQVHGLESLSIVDNSIWPIILSGAPSATVYAEAEKAADIIKKRYGLTSG
ncbi:choline dehydrogenase-like protein [Mollisia scopiformis]|uniref:Choline dehydrogenase-like protein n=1 Tax=Mollisia scopiformis TaxID=149040 RepID=A0A194XFJ7_MOLSC|nr:choline dehydrogenase-like protein [Mollisia scopiformis]KUJ18909.1 choline dehydrogenase-like protein [Mollisia scopiformis]